MVQHRAESEKTFQGLNWEIWDGNYRGRGLYFVQVLGDQEPGWTEWGWIDSGWFLVWRGDGPVCLKFESARGGKEAS